MIFIVMGNTCSGKSTLMNFAVKEYNLYPIKQYTTRNKRNDNDKEYIFVSLLDLKKTDFVNIKKYNGNYYGIAKKDLLDEMERDKILITDFRTAKIIKKEYNAQIIYMDTPLKERIKRIFDIKNSRNRLRILLDFFYYWELLFADIIINNNKDIQNLESKAREYFGSKIEYT